MGLVSPKIFCDSLKNTDGIEPQPNGLNKFNTSEKSDHQLPPTGIYFYLAYIAVLAYGALIDQSVTMNRGA